MADDLNFVKTAELARLDRADTGETEPVFEALLRRSLGDQPPPADGFGNGLRAAVNAGSILSFVADLTPEEKSDVLFSTQFAQRAASAKHDRFGRTDDWYRVYIEVMERLGWTGEGFAFTQRLSSSGEFRMDKSALDVIATIATGNQLAILVKALDTMKSLAEEDGAIRVFELQAVAELSGNYQLGAVQRAENGALALALGGFRFRTDDRRRRVLFWKWGSEEIEFWAAAQKMTLNAKHYTDLRRTVAERLGAEASAYIVGIDIV